MARVLLLTLGLVVVTACGRSTFAPPAAERPALLATLKQPPLNMPLQSARRSPATALHELDDLRRQITAPGPPALFVLAGRSRASGSVALSGMLAVQSNAIELAPAQQPPTTILYRLPRGLTSPPHGRSPGAVTVVDRTSTAGRDRRVIVSGNDRLLMAQAQGQSANPLSVDFLNGLRLVQRTTAGNANMDVQVVAFDGDRQLQTLPVGQPVRVGMRDGVLQVFIDRSYVVHVSDDTGQYSGGYVLSAWIVRAPE
jgi:hypothetical protein